MLKSKVYMPTRYTPGYVSLCCQGELKKRADLLSRQLLCCRLCPHRCGADRVTGEKGVCQAPAELHIAKAVLHCGEEPPVSGSRGSGTVFFTRCSLTCCFCQNYQISQQGLGSRKTPEELADMMLSLQAQRAHNINLVSGTHFLPLILEALHIAAQQGLCLPLVYNTNGYESVETLRLLEGVVDIYLPDAKYADDLFAQRYSGAKNYAAVNLAALAEMYRQTGGLVVDSDDIGLKGLIIRHLVLPEDIAGTEKLFSAIKSRLGREIHVSLMAQYTPCHRAGGFPELNRKTTRAEYEQAVHAVERLGFDNGWIQQWQDMDHTFLPDFTQERSWN